MEDASTLLTPTIQARVDAWKTFKTLPSSSLAVFQAQLNSLQAEAIQEAEAFERFKAKLEAEFLNKRDDARAEAHRGLSAFKHALTIESNERKGAALPRGSQGDRPHCEVFGP